MKFIYIFGVIALLACAGCGQYGYHPNYIISHDEEHRCCTTPLR